MSEPIEHKLKSTDAPLPGAIRVKQNVPAGAPLNWLRRGWSDLLATRFRAVFYGLIFALMGYAVTVLYATRWQLTMGLISGFFLMGPFICTGIYGLSQRLHRGRKVSLWQSLTCWSHNIGSIAFFAVILTFLMVVWARVSVIIFALSSTHHFATLSGVLGSIFSFDNPQFVLLWGGVGFIFASLVFAVGAISVPIMLDRDSDTLMAMFASAKALYSNPKALYIWAVLIVLIIGISLLFGFWPLLITAPVVGHATWHAYRQLVEHDE
jgi:uncharacterized membrane protein